MRIAFVILVSLGCVAGPLAAQDQTSSSKIRPADNTNAQGNILGEKPEAVLKVVKLKALVNAIDLEQRTITLERKKEEEPLVLAFAQPVGREQIKVSKRAAKSLGKKKLRLEELAVGTEIEAQYYPSLGQLLELTVE